MSVRRAHIVCLIALALGLLGRAAPTPQVSAGPVEVAAEISVERIGEIVGQANPVLSERQRERIGHSVLRSSEEHGLDPQLVTAIILVESGARPWVRSPKGALGLMQVMPHMAESLGFGGSLASIEHNVEAGCLILADNIRRLGEEDGISAYFWGSEIRGVAYLDRVRAARATVRRHAES